MDGVTTTMTDEIDEIDEYIRRSEEEYRAWRESGGIPADTPASAVAALFQAGYFTEAALEFERRHPIDPWATPMTTHLTEAMERAMDDLIDRWHRGEGPGVSFAEFLGLTPAQYRAWVNGHDLPGEYVVPERPRAVPGPAVEGGGA